MFYREAIPPSQLSPFVLAYWEFAVAPNTPDPFVHHIFPDGCVLMAYSSQAGAGDLRLRVVGPTLKSREVNLSPGNITWGVRLQPAACQAVIGCAPKALRGQSVPCGSLNANLSVSLLAGLKGCDTFESAVLAFSQRLLQANLNPEAIDPKAALAARLIAESGEDLKIDKVAAAVGLSVRQLERRFLAAVGITPKQFARTRRVRKIAVALAESEQITWAALAAEMGFVDQAHLGHEFAALTGSSPTSFARRLRKIGHGELLK
jgi:AraC-like DNA-binding protein